MTNPYARYLGDRDPFEVMAASPDRWAGLLARLDPSQVNAPLAPGKWSVREVLAHLADCEVAFGFRLRQALAEPHHVIQPFDQDAWAAKYSAYDAESGLALFTAMRRWNLLLLGTVTTGEFHKPVTHPERGAMTFRTIVETMAGHDLNHLERCETVESF